MRDWPFLGRAEELSRLFELLSDPDARGVVLAGPAGVGKTRLGLELLERADKAGMATARVMATNPLAGLPFGSVAVLVPEFKDSWKVAEPVELARRLAEAVVERAADRRIALLVDDAHLLDEGSASLIHQLVMMNAAFVIATVRSGTSAPRPVVALWKEELTERVDLEALPDVTIEQVVSGFLGGPVSGALVSALASRSQGNMLFVRELVHGALAAQALRSEAGIWHLVGELHPSDRLVELVEARLTDVDEEERAALELLAVGEPLADRELEALVAEDVVERLEKRGLILTTLRAGQVTASLAHPLYGDVLRAELSAAKMRRLARELAEIAEAADVHQPDDLLRIGNWRLRCGGGDAGALLGAARVAYERFDYSLARQLAKAAEDAGAGFEAQLLQAELTALHGDRAGAEAMLAALAALVVDPDQRSRVALARADNALLRVQLDDVIRICDDAVASGIERGRVALGARRSWAVLYKEGPQAALDASENLLLECHTDADLVAVSCGRALALAHAGRTEDALAHAAMGEEAHRAAWAEFHWPVAMHSVYRCEALIGAGRFVEAEQIALCAYQAALDEQSRWNQAYAAHVVATALVARGRVRSALRYALETCALFSEFGEPLTLAPGLLCLAYTAAVGGKASTAADAIRRFDALDLPPSYQWHWAGARHARAWTAVAAGDLPGARRLFEEEALAAERTGDLVMTGAALHGLVRIGHADRATERLRNLATRVEGELAPTRADHAEALVGRDRDRLEAVSSAFEAFGADLLAAEAAADAAVLWRQAGDPRKAMAVEHHAASLLDRCEGAVTTPATLSVETRARLTPAERDTALLASEGYSNKEIAGRMYVSTRTVEARLQHVYSKLGISRRGDLRACMSQLTQ